MLRWSSCRAISHHSTRARAAVDRTVDAAASHVAAAWISTAQGVVSQRMQLSALAKKPKWRILRKPSGRTCNRILGPNADAVDDQMGDPVRQGIGLTGSRPGDHQERRRRRPGVVSDAVCGGRR